MITTLLIILILLLTIASAFCSLSEIALFSLSSSKIKSYRHQQDPKKRLIAKLLKQSKSLLVTIFFLNTVVNILVQNITSDLFDPISASWELKVGVPLVLVLIFGELLPKYLGLLYNEKISVFAAPFYEWFQSHTSMLRNAITSVANFFSRVLFFYLKVEKPLSQDELEHLLETSEGRGIVHKEEAKLLQGYLSLEGKCAKDLMMPRNTLPYYDIELPLSKLIFLFSEKKLSNVLICRGSIDNFLGLLNAGEFFIKKNQIHTPEDLLKLVYRPFFVPETTSLKLLLEQFESRDAKLAIVVDEYGAISGMIPKYDLIAEIAKPVTPLHEMAPEYTRVAKDAIIASGTMPLDDLTELFGQELESVYHPVTIGGYLTEMLGCIPHSGTTYQTGTLFFRILSADNTHIRKVYIQQLASQERGQRGGKESL